MTRHWTPHEDRRLRDLAPVCTVRQIARLLGRPPGGVEARARKLEGVWVTRSVMRILGRRKWTKK